MIVAEGSDNLLKKKKKMDGESIYLFSEYVLNIILFSLFLEVMNKLARIVYVQFTSLSQCGL